MFATENYLKIINEKTKCTIFNKTGRHIPCSVPCGDSVINPTREYKYLEFFVTPSGEVNIGIIDLKSRAMYALVQLRRKIGVHFRENIGMSYYLFDTLIKPIRLYCSDFWGILRIRKRTQVIYLGKTVL